MGIAFCNPYLLQFAVLIIMCLSLKAMVSTGYNSILSPGADTILPGQSISGKRTITSEGGIFELGFFSPGASQNHYIGIWYKNISKQIVVWVANREKSVSNPVLSALELLEDGELVLLNQFKTTIWSTNSTANVPKSTLAILLDCGNFVVRDKLDPNNIIWQSFDHLTDTWLPGAKLGYLKLQNEKRALTSWKSSENPAPGIFSLEIDPTGAASHLLLWNGSKIYWKTGNWPGTLFSRIPEMQLNYHITNITYISNDNETSFTFAAAPPSALTRFTLDVSGQFKKYVWSKPFGNEWLLRVRPPSRCLVYGVCGAFSICNENDERICDCPKGYEPKFLEDWVLKDHSDGCVRKTALACASDGHGKDSFLAMHHMRFPVNSNAFAARNIEECRLQCLSECSCTAYAYENQCLIWKEDLYNLQQLLPNEKGGKDFYLRVAPSDSESRAGTWIVIVVAVSFLCLLGIGLLVFMAKRRIQISPNAFYMDGQLMLFKYSDLRRATKNFSEKIGEGGFGTVYKGILHNSSAVAVKILKSYSMQGEKQFRAEVGTIGMIQHINLVHLLGFSVEGSRRFLVYDYMPNGSLASTLFGKNQKILDWKTRCRIAVGIAKGIAYLHEECRDCIIHCDIKPENILLDVDYNPKVSDFGLAKIMGRDFSQVLTTMRGTRGYLAPEWISGEPITLKADIYSYGMVLFEIISGRRNRDILDDDFGDYFPTHVVRTISNKGEDVRPLLDNRLEGNVVTEELERACKAACWCIQDYEKDRPTMGQIVQILEGVSEVGVPPIPRFLRYFIGSFARSSVQELKIQMRKDVCT